MATLFCGTHVFSLSLRQIVTDVSVVSRRNASIPAFTICPMPGMNLPLAGDFANNISNFCPGESEVSKECIDQAK